MIASWCEPEKAVNTSSPPYGWRGCTGSWLQCSTVRITSLMSEKSMPGIDALRVQVEAERDEADVAGALAVAEQAALDALRARHQRELGRGDAAAAVVVRMHRETTLSRRARLRRIHSIWSA